MIDRVLLAELSRLDVTLASVNDRDVLEVPIAVSDRIVADHRFVEPRLHLEATLEVAARKKTPSPHFRGHAYDAPTLVCKVPYEGHPDFLRCYLRARSADTSCEFFFSETFLCFEIPRERASSDYVVALRERHLDCLRKGIAPISNAVRTYNTSVLARIRERLGSRARGDER